MGFGIGPTELLLAAGVGLLLFGNRLPSIARSMGRSLIEFKRGFKEVEQEIKELEDDLK